VFYFVLLLYIKYKMNDYLDMSQYASALNISAMTQQFAQAKADMEKQKDEALMPISELALGGGGTAGIEGIGSAIKTAVITKGKELLASKLEDAGFDKETIARAMDGDARGTFESLVAKAKGIVADKVEGLKSAASDAAENLKQQALDKVDELKQQGSDAFEQAKSDLQDKMDSFRSGESTVEDGFPEGEDLFPQGAGGRVVPTEGIEEPASVFEDTSSAISRSGNIMETSFGQTAPEDFMGYNSVANAPSTVGLPEGFSNVVGDVSKTISGISDTATGAIGDASAAISEGVSGAIAGGTEAATGLLEGIGSTVLEGVSAVADIALGPLGILAVIGGGIAGIIEADKAPKALPEVINPSVQFGA
jgi:hypothetical protein